MNYSEKHRAEYEDTHKPVEQFNAKFSKCSGCLDLCGLIFSAPGISVHITGTIEELDRALQYLTSIALNKPIAPYTKKEAGGNE